MNLSKRTILAVSIAALLVPAMASAVDYNFSSLSTATVSWNDGNNWTTLPSDDGNFPNAIGDFANVTGDFTLGATTINLNTGITIGRLDIGDTAGSGTLLLQTGTGTNTITFDVASGDAQLNAVGAGTGLVTISAGLVLNDNLVVNKTTAKGLTLSGGINLNANTLTFQGAGATNGLTTASGIITGTGAVVVNTSGTAGTNGPAINFTAAHNYSGGTTLTAGVIVVGISSAGAANAPTSGALGTGTLTINGGTIRQTAAANRTLFNSVIANADFNLGESQSGVTSGLTMAGSLTLTGGTRIITVSQNGTQTQANNHTISGVIDDGAGTFGLTKTGTAPLVLSGANTYEGVTTVAQGNLILAGNAPVSAAGTLGNASSAVTLGTAANTAGILTGAAVTIDRAISTGGTGALTLGGNSNNNSSFTGTITLDQNFTLTSVATGGNVTSFTGPIAITSGSRTLNKTGVGVVELTNTSGHTNTTIAAGTLRLSNAGSFGSGTMTFTNTSGATAATLQLGLGGLDLTKNLIIASGSTGATELGGSNAAATTVTYSGGITLNKAALLSNATATATTRFTGVITDGAGSFGVTVNGPGIVEFNGAAANSYNGLTTVASGTLFLNSSFANGAVIGDGNTATPDLLISGGTVLFGQADQLATNTTIQFSSGTLNVGGFTQTIFDLDYTGGAILNASGLTITNGTDLFLFDGTNIAAPTVLGRKVIYAGSTTSGTISNTLALDADPTHELAINDGAAAVDTEISGVISNDSTDSTVIKRGSGVLKLSSGTGNTFGGAGQTVTIEGGSLAVTADNQLGNAANSLTFTGGSLRFDTAFATARTLNVTASGGGIETPTGVTVTIGNASQISGGAGVLAKRGDGVLEITADQSATWTGGSAALVGGVLSISAENQLGAAGNDVTFQGGTLRVTTGFTADAGKVFTLGTGGGTLEVAAAQILTIPGTAGVVGNTVLNKTGDGRLVIAGANATLAAGAAVNVAAGTLELQNAQSLGNSPKAAITLSGGALSLRNDVATSFNNPVTVSATATVTSDVLTPATAGVTQTLGALSIGAFTLTADVGANVTGGAPTVAFSGSTLTGGATFSPSTGATLNTGGITLGANKLTLDGAGTVSLNGVIAGGPGVGLVAIEKNGLGTAISSATTSTFTGDVAINAGVYRLSGAGAFGASTNVIKLNGGTLQHSAGTPAYALQFNGGTLAATGADRVWGGITAATPSITFTTNTAFSLTDALVPATDRSIDLGAAGSGVVTSTGAVDLTISANATNSTSLKKLRFASTTDSGSVTGTLTINANAVGQIRSGGGTQNALGSGVLLRLNTGINLGSPGDSGRLELVSNSAANFGNDVELLGDSSINVQRLSGGGTNFTMTLNDLTIGAHTLQVVDAAGSGYDLTFDGTTTLLGNATFSTGAAVVTLGAITDGAGSFGVTKIGNAVLDLTGTGAFDGALVVTAGTVNLSGTANQTSAVTINGGTLTLIGNERLNNAATVAVSTGTFALGANTETIAALNTTGGTFTSTVGGMLTTGGLSFNSNTGSTVNAVLAGTGGLTKAGTGLLTLAAANTYLGDTVLSSSVTLTANNAIPGTSNVSISAGTLAAGITVQSFGTLSVTGSGAVTSTATGQITTTGVTINSSGTSTLAGVLAGTNGLSKSGGGTLNLNATNTYSGLTTVTGGTVNLGAVGALPGDLDIGSGATVAQTVADGFAATPDVTVTGGGLDFGGKSATLDDVTITGVADNTFKVVTNNGAPTMAVITMDILTLNSSTASTAPSVTINSGGSGAKIVANQVVIQGGFSGGAFLIGGAAVGTGLEVGAGGLQISNVATGSYDAIVMNHGTNGGRILLGGDLTFTGNANTASVGLVVGTTSGVRGKIDLGGGVRTFDIGDGAAAVDLFTNLNITNGSLLKIGAGTFSISGPTNTYTGDTTINGGVLKLGAAGVIPDGVGNGNVVLGASGTFDVGGFAETINGLSGSGTVDNTFDGAATLTVGSNDATSVFTGTIQNTGGVLSALTVDKIGIGTLTLSGAQDYARLITSAGTTNVNGSFTGGTAIVNANATTNFGASQELDQLNIGTVPLAGFSGGQGFTGGAVVPEPGSIGLLMVGALGFLSRRRRNVNSPRA